jgi:hypothetical protein
MRLICKAPPDLKNIHLVIAREIRKKQLDLMIRGLKAYQRAIMQFTPVYTGRTLINYRWSVGGPISRRRAAVANPKLPGKTSDLQLGSEPRRAANQAVVQFEFSEVLNALRSGGPYQKVSLVNNMPNFTDIEYGSYRDGSRTPPGGMTRAGEAALSSLIPGIRKS